MGVISTHGADVGIGSRIRISFTPPASRTIAFRSATQSTRDSARHVHLGMNTLGDTAGAARQAAGQAECAGMTGLDA